MRAHGMCDPMQVPRVRAVPGMEASGSIKSQDIRFLTKPDAFKRIISKALLGINKDRWVKEQ